MPSSLLSRISAKLAAGRMRTANAIVVVFATLCTCVLHPRSSFLRYAMASASNAGPILQRVKAAEVDGNLQNVRVVGGGVLARNVQVAMEKIGGLVNRQCGCMHPTVALVWTSGQTMIVSPPFLLSISLVTIIQYSVYKNAPQYEGLVFVFLKDRICRKVGFRGDDEYSS